MTSELERPTPRSAWLYVALAAVLLLGLAFVLLATELGARMLWPHLAPTREERAKFWTHDPLLGWAHVPNTSGRFNHPDFSVSVSHNSEGLRDKEHTGQSPGAKRLLVLGDSFTWGFGVEQEQRFTSLLDDAHTDWEVINAGVSGYSTDQQYLYLRERGIRYRPDAVLILLFRDDLYGNTQDELFLYNKPRFRLEGDVLIEPVLPVKENTLAQRFERWVLQRTYLGKIIYQAFAAVGHLLRSQDSEESAPAWSAVNLPEGSVNLTNRLLRETSRFCREHGAQLVVATAGLSPEVAASLQDAADTHGYRLFSLDDALSKATRPVTFPRDAHWNPWGHEVVAREIDKRLSGFGIWQTKPSP